MRTRLRACARGENYLPREARNGQAYPSVPFGFVQGLGAIRRRINSVGAASPEPVAKKARISKPMTWQERLESVLERDVYIWQNSVFTDITFCVGKEKEIFKCHRLFLAKTSPVFGAMLYGEHFPKEDIVSIPEISAPAFRVLVQYTYEGQMTLTCVEVACEVLYLSKKYLLCQRVQNELRAYIWAHMHPDHTWQTMDFAYHNDEHAMYEAAVKLVCLNLEASLSQPSFLELSEETLVAILKHNVLHQQSEAELFSSCLKWGRHQLEHDNIEETPESLRQVLAPIIPHILFLTMKPEEFIKGPAKTDIFNNSDKFTIVSYLISPQESPVPNFINTQVKPVIREDNIFRVFATDDVPDEVILNESTYDMISAFDFNKKIDNVNVILSIQLPCQSDRYDDNITVPHYEEKFSVCIINKTKKKIESKVLCTLKTEYNANLMYLLPQSIELTHIDPDDLLQLKIIYHKSGIYIKHTPFHGTLLKSNIKYQKYDVRLKTCKFVQVVWHN